MPRRTRSQLIDCWAEQYAQYLRECSLVRLSAALHREWRERQEGSPAPDHHVSPHKHAA